MNPELQQSSFPEKWNTLSVLNTFKYSNNIENNVNDFNCKTFYENYSVVK